MTHVPGTDFFYYVKSPEFRENFVASTVGLATSRDGIVFRDRGEVLPAGGDRIYRLLGDEDFEHEVGRQGDNCWLVEGEAGMMAYREEWQELPPGNYRFSFTLDFRNPQRVVDLVEVEILEAGRVIASRRISRVSFLFEGVPTEFSLPFRSRGQVAMRLRSFGGSTLCFSTAYIRKDAESDERLASFASVWKDGDTYYMAYEGASRSSDGEIRLATSSDGRRWTKDEQPLLASFAPWQSINVGTPSLWKQEDTWYLFYHGFDGQKLEVGLMAGSDIRALQPVNAGDPIITAGSGWDGGTVGKRSLIYEEPYFYMVYEGSSLPENDGEFDKASWASGLARSSDLIHWEKYPGNPIVGSTGSGFGFDGPEFYRDTSGALHIYFRNMQGSTDRISLQ